MSFSYFKQIKLELTHKISVVAETRKHWPSLLICLSRLTNPWEWGKSPGSFAREPCGIFTTLALLPLTQPPSYLITWVCTNYASVWFFNCYYSRSLLCLPTELQKESRTVPSLVLSSIIAPLQQSVPSQSQTWGRVAGVHTGTSHLCLHLRYFGEGHKERKDHKNKAWPSLFCLCITHVVNRLFYCCHRWKAVHIPVFIFMKMLSI